MFKWLKRILLLIIIFLALLVGITLTSENSGLVTPILFGISLPEHPLGLWFAIILLLGALSGLLLSSVPVLWGRQTLASKDRKIKHLEKEINNLRTSGLKGEL